MRWVRLFTDFVNLEAIAYVRVVSMHPKEPEIDLTLTGGGRYPVTGDNARELLRLLEERAKDRAE